MTARLVLALTLVAAVPAAAADKEPVEKIPVTFGSWTGPSASSFKSALKKGLGKDFTMVSAKKSPRVIIEGTSTEQGKGVVIRVIVKSPKSGEIIESREFTFSRPQPSGGTATKMIKATVEIVRRAPTD
jgi:hypothetical protein